jgi:malate/lactate dehydrogenase
VLGTKGVERIIEIELDDAERKMFQASVDHVKELVKNIKI